MSAPVMVGPSPQGGGPTPSLTDLEMEVLRRAALGETAAAIGRDLGYSGKSIGKTASVLARKLGARNMPHAVLLACRAGFLDGRPRRHGDHAGYTRHQKRGEVACAACKAGERAYQVERRLRRRQQGLGAARLNAA